MTQPNTKQAMVLCGISAAPYGAGKVSSLGQNRISANSALANRNPGYLNHSILLALRGHEGRLLALTLD